MRKDREMYFENQGYFGNPMMGQPMFQNSGMYANSGMPMNPYMNMNMSNPMSNFQNSFGYNQNNELNILEQKINRMERQIRRLDSRVTRLENKLNISPMDYKSTTDDYSINETNMYMM